MHPREVPFVPQQLPMDSDRTLPFHKRHHHRNAVPRRHAQTQVDVVDNRLPFDQFRPSLSAQVPQNGANSTWYINRDFYLAGKGESSGKQPEMAWGSTASGAFIRTIRRGARDVAAYSRVAGVECVRAPAISGGDQHAHCLAGRVPLKKLGTSRRTPLLMTSILALQSLPGNDE